MRGITLVLFLIMLAGCDAEILSPSRELSSVDPLAARASQSDGVSLGAAPLSPTAIGMSWNDNARDEDGWEVHRSTAGAAGTFTLRASVPANSPGYTDNGLNTLTEYCYKVRSFKAQGSHKTFAKFSNTSCAKTRGPPPAPTGTNAIPRSSTIVDVTWTNNAPIEADSVRVERSAAPGGPWQTAVRLGPIATSHADFGRAPDAPVCYRAVASNQFGESASNVDCTAPPRGVSNIVASSTDARTIDVTWTDASSVEDGYEVQRTFSGNAFTTIANLPANTASFRDGSVVAGTRYDYRVRAKKDAGFSDFSAPAFAAVPSAPPLAPNALSANPGGSTVAILSWSSPPASVTGLRVQRSTDGQASWVDAGSINASQASFADGGRVPERQVCYRIFAFNVLGESGPSNVDCTIPPLNPSEMRLEPQDEFGGNILWFTDRSNVEEGLLIRITSCWPTGCRFRDIDIQASFQGGEIGQWVYLEPEESIEVYFYHDGGLSDPGLWAAQAAASVPAANNSARLRPQVRMHAPRTRSPSSQRSNQRR